MRETGTVREFGKSYGWLLPASGGRAIFVHHKQIIGMEGFRELFAGDKVEYEVEHDDRGRPLAARVKVIEAAEDAA